MGVVCAPKKQNDNIQSIQDQIAQSKSKSTIEERINQIKEFLTLKSEDVQQIASSNSEPVSINDFQIKQYLAKGGFGKVYTAAHIKTGKIYAMKIINKSFLKEENVKLQTISQRLILQNLNHPFLVRLHFAFHSSSKIFMLVDYVEKGELFYIMRSRGKFTQDEARFYAAEIFLAIQYLHKKNIMYRDLKPENVLIGSDGHIKVTDFGISKVFANNFDVTTFSMCGTPQYIAPQVLKQKGYSFQSDWFSFGALVFDMITGKPPFYSKNQVEMVEKKLEKSSVPLPKGIKPQTKSFLRGLLNFTPSERLGADRSQQIKNHPFFANINFDKLSNKEMSPPSSIWQSLDSITIDCLAQNKSTSFKSSVMARTVRSNLNKELKFAGFQFNKHRRNAAFLSSMSEEDAQFAA